MIRVIIIVSKEASPIDNHSHTVNHVYHNQKTIGSMYIYPQICLVFGFLMVFMYVNIPKPMGFLWVNHPQLWSEFFSTKV